MMRRGQAHIATVHIHYLYFQAFQFFLTKIWEEVDICGAEPVTGNVFQVDLALSETDDAELILHLWDDWKASLMPTMYAVHN